MPLTDRPALDPPITIGRMFHAALLILGLSTACALAGLSSTALAAPFVPKSDTEVLERLPAKPTDPAISQLRDLRQRLAATPNDLTLAVDLADRYYRIAAREGDPRYIGYAQAALAPWWKQNDAPTGVLVLRAALSQYLHDFDGALKDLTRALERDPDNLAAWSYRAVIYIVMARYDEARHDCTELARRDHGLVAGACLPTVAALTGKAAAAYDSLAELLRRNPGATASQRLWVLTRLAEIAQRLDRRTQAEAHYRAALALGIEDQYLLTAWAEFLLDLKRPAEVVELLKDKTRNDVLLLRLALAESALGSPATAAHVASLQSRIDAARLREDKLHLSDEALFELRFRQRPGEAVRLAKENWALAQREPSDARILLEAALAARDSKAAAPALQWLTDSRHEDPILTRLATQVRALP